MPKVRSLSKPGGLPIIHRFAAGIDIEARFHVAAVSPDLCDESVQTFQAFTSDLERMADWLVATGTKMAVMESTGVYWVAAYEVLKSRGLEVVLANAREARAVPDRKSDVNDAQWLQRLHAFGLLRASFRPGRDIADLRAYLGARERHTDYAAAHIQHMQKQALALYDFYQRCIDECDAEIERAVAGLNIDRPVPEAPLPKAKHRNKLPSDPNFDVRSAMYQLAGTDLTQIHGIGPFLALRLIAECGTDLSRWRTAKHFTS
jgi:transposase